jgi:hypothetical protein
MSRVDSQATEANAVWQSICLEQIFTQASPGHAVYFNNVVLTQRQTLQHTFPRTSSLLGAQAFASLAFAFLQAFGREDFDWGEYGAQWPQFLGSQTATAEIALPQHIATIACAEWAWHRANRADNKVFDQASFALLESTPLDRCYIRFAPGVDIISGAVDFTYFYDIDAFINKYQQTRHERQTATTFIIWRPEYAPLGRILPAEFAPIWHAINDYVTTQQPCSVQALVEYCQKYDIDPMLWLQDALQRQHIFGLTTNRP